MRAIGRSGDPAKPDIKKSETRRSRFEVLITGHRQDKDCKISEIIMA